MKFIFLGIAVILFGVALITAFSSTGLGYLSGTKVGIGVSFFGLFISVVGFFLKDTK